MRTLGRRVALAIVVLGGALVLPRGVDAHALLQSSDPPAGATLASAPAAVTITFGEAPDPRLSSIKVLDVGGTDHTTGSVQAVPGQPTVLRIALAPLTDGTYTVTWRTVSAVDGHSAAGSFAFGVGVAPSQSGSASGSVTSSPSASLPAVLARWLLFLGLAALLGAAFVGFAIEPRPPRSVIRLAGVGWLGAALGSVGVVAVQWSDTGADLSSLLGSSIGTGALERAAALVATGIVVAVLVAWRGPVGRWLFGLAAAAAAGTILVDVVNGHAAAGSLSAFDIAIQWLHGVNAGLWIGGLAALLLAVRGAPSDEKARAARRFSRWATVAIGLVAATGIVRAVQEVGTVDDLLTSDFGRLVIVKSALLGVLAVLGASNRFYSVPAAVRSLRGLRRVGSTEVALGTVVFAVTALLVNLAPPSSVGAAAPAPPTSVVATGSDFGTSVRLRLVVTPGTPGQNQFTAALADYDTGAPAAATSVSLRFDIASQSGIGSSTLVLTSSAPGSFTGSGANLSIDGIWKVTATVSGAGGAVEVPLALATALSAQHVETVEAAGAPTISTVHLGDGNSVQLYLDPGRAGTNDLHATFFDPSGTELPVATATFLVTPSGGPGTVIAGRQLEPGHFTASVSPPAGEVAVDVVGPNPAGGQLHAHLTMQVQP